MIPSEAPLLHNQVKLVDPVDRQACGALVRGLPSLSVHIGVDIYPKGMVGCMLYKLGGAISWTCPPGGNPNTEVAEKQDGNLNVFSH